MLLQGHVFLIALSSYPVLNVFEQGCWCVGQEKGAGQVPLGGGRRYELLAVGWRRNSSYLLSIICVLTFREAASLEKSLRSNSDRSHL